MSETGICNVCMYLMLWMLCYFQTIQRQIIMYQLHILKFVIHVPLPNYTASVVHWYFTSYFTPKSMTQVTHNSGFISLNQLLSSFLQFSQPSLQYCAWFVRTYIMVATSVSLKAQGLTGVHLRPRTGCHHNITCNYHPWKQKSPFELCKFLSELNAHTDSKMGNRL